MRRHETLERALAAGQDWGHPQMEAVLTTLKRVPGGA